MLAEILQIYRMCSRKSTEPIRMWIDGKCYNIRKFNGKRSFKYQDSPELSKSDPPRDRLFSTKFHLPSLYYIQLDRLFRKPQINALETETNTIITYPKHGEDGSLEISGDSEESIEEARGQLHSFIADIREQMSAKQFIAIPLLSDEIKENFEKFKVKVLAENHEGVEESIFQSALKLHLTVVVFTLLDGREKEEALEALEECRTYLVGITGTRSKQMKIKVAGLKCMNDNLAKANVLYAESHFTDDSDSEKTLQEVVNSVGDIFYNRGLVRGYQENIKLHMTVMNTKYRFKRGDSPKKGWGRRQPFNAMKIMEKYKNYYFGEAVFDTIYLSSMSSKGEDGFYKSLGTIKI